MELTFQFLHNGHLTIEFLKLRQPAEASGSAGKFLSGREETRRNPGGFQAFPAQSGRKIFRRDARLCRVVRLLGAAPGNKGAALYQGPFEK
ncbi:hypothetical protein [Oscillibacter sp. 1-3]|uniref:hypothetical protein n=1 Tax=Oscillibacter sp. 1-3 TaxID=1235797 RepID=UPI0003A07528|nr:hypothetical protein [Oscillibacter sp. 1-3]